MNGISALGRVGAVPYLNASPLVYSIERQIQYFHPRELVLELREERVLVGLVPVVECFRNRPLEILNGISIASDGPVESVYIASKVPIRQIKVLHQDDVSQTSVLLSRVILERKHKVFAEYSLVSFEKISTLMPESLLLIGDQALRFRRQPGACAYHFYDLGQEWKEWAQLPFVYAVWAFQPDLGGLRDEIACRLLKAKELGLNHLEEIISQAEHPDKTFVRHYLSESLRYDLGSREREGIRKFQQELFAINALSAIHEPIYFSVAGL